MGSEACNKDQIDFPPNDFLFRKRDVLLLMTGFMTYILDMGLDMLTVYRHWIHEDFIWSYLTIIFIVCPSLIVSTISLCWYILDEMNRDKGEPKTRTSTWVIRSIFLIFQLAPLIRYFDSLYYGLRSRKAWFQGKRIEQKRLYLKMLYTEADCILLRLYESFFEAMPQLVLQLYILCLVRASEYSNNWIYILWFSSFTSLVNVAWGVTAYSRGSRFTHLNKNNISLIGTVVLMLWQVFIIGSRAIIFVLFAVEFTFWVLVFSLSHWILMTVWLLSRRSFARLGGAAYEIFLCVLMAGVYLFTFINDQEEETRKKYIFYYIICGFENAVMIILWIFYSQNLISYYYVGPIVHYLLFFLGLVLMGIYYRYLHPSLYKDGTPRSPFVDPPCPANTMNPSPSSSLGPCNLGATHPPPNGCKDSVSPSSLELTVANEQTDSDK